MRRKALVGVVAAAALPLLTTASFGQSPAPAPAKKPAPPATAVQPRWRVQPTPQVAPVQPQTAPQTTPRTSRGYTQYEELLRPREWPRDDPIRAMPEMPGDRLDNQFGLQTPKAYETPRPTDSLGPY